MMYEHIMALFAIGVVLVGFWVVVVFVKIALT